jgi:cell division septation protein DedD
MISLFAFLFRWGNARFFTITGGETQRLERSVHMKTIVRAVMVLALACSLAAPAEGAAWAQQGTAEPVEFVSPQAGQAVQGSVPVLARVLVSDFEAAELSFAYAGDRTETWFLLAEYTGSLRSEKLVDWDTTTLTDGVYTLRLVVVRKNGQTVTAYAQRVRVRNYTPIETPTPTPIPTAGPGDTATPAPTQEPTQTATATPVPFTATPLPTNPAQITLQDISGSTGRGAMAVAAFFTLMGLYISLRRSVRRGRKRSIF